MSVIIGTVEEKSSSFQKGIRSGDILVSINGHEINDVLDYRFYIMERRLHLELLRDGSSYSVELEKGQYDDIGLDFNTYLMDKQRSCRNQCVFCFIDQLPGGLRESLYFKDDDSRLSFLFGNYITLTNLTPREVDRIIEMHISPVNVSVHTTNPDLRVKMMKNKNAGKSLEIIWRLADAGIQINTQLVLCPNLNDKEELKRTLNDLGSLYPCVQSIACVPVGLTKYREGLYPLRPFTKQEAAETIGIIETFGEAFKKQNGTRLAFPGDEFYLLAGMPIPEPEFYEDFAQIENGVGMWASLKSEFMDALTFSDEQPPDRNISIATGTGVAPLLRSLVDEAMKKWHNLNIKVYEIKNHFFGENITVSGLITGTDLLAQLADADLGMELLLPSNMLRREGDMFLDDVTLTELSDCLGVPVTPVSNDGWGLLEAMFGNSDVSMI